MINAIGKTDCNPSFQAKNIMQNKTQLKSVFQNAKDKFVKEVKSMDDETKDRAVKCLGGFLLLSALITGIAYVLSPFVKLYKMIIGP